MQRLVDYCQQQQNFCFIIKLQLAFGLNLTPYPMHQILASRLINAQPLLAHSPAADDNCLIGCTSHDLTDDWSLASTHFVDS